MINDFIIKTCELKGKKLSKRSMALFRFHHNPNGRNDLMLPRLSFWYFAYRVPKAASYAGYGNYTKEELTSVAEKDLTALNSLLGKSKFFFSDSTPCEADFAVFGLTAQLKYNDTGLMNHFLQSILSD